MHFIPPLLHAPGPRAAWRLALILLSLLVCVLAFSPRAPGLDFDHADKLNHIAAFLCLGVCAALSMHAGRRGALAAGLGLLAFGIFIELVQMQIPQRSADWQDVAADMLGVLAGLGLVALARHFWPLPARPGGPDGSAKSLSR
jgi:VanZ family protein